MKKLDLDAATIAVVKRVMNAPPKQNAELKVGRPKEKKRGPKARASSAKRRSA